MVKAVGTAGARDAVRSIQKRLIWHESLRSQTLNNAVNPEYFHALDVPNILKRAI